MTHEPIIRKADKPAGPAPDTSEYLPKTDLDINLAGAAMYITVYARIVTGSKRRYVQYDAAARMDTDMAVITNTVRILLASLYAPANEIAIITKQQFDNAETIDPGAIKTHVVSSAKVIEPI